MTVILICLIIDRNPNGLTYNSGREKRPVKSLVVGRPILLALEDIDGGPSFLEKALRFLEKYGKILSCLLKTPGTFPYELDYPEISKL